MKREESGLTIPEVADQLHQMISHLAGRCDGARSLDGQGFNKFDARRGHQLAKEDPSLWRWKKCLQVFPLVNKYRGQVESAGFVLPDMRDTIFWGAGRWLGFRFAYNKDMVSDIKRQWGERVWDSKAGVFWVRINAANARNVARFVSRWEMKITSAAQRVVDGVSVSLSERCHGIRSLRSVSGGMDRGTEGKRGHPGYSWCVLSSTS